MPNAFGQGCKSVPHAKFYNLSTEHNTLLFILHRAIDYVHGPAELATTEGIEHKTMGVRVRYFTAAYPDVSLQTKIQDYCINP